MQHTYLDATISTKNLIDTEAFQIALCDAVANGRLFLLNNRGEYEEVVLFSSWVGDQILTVVSPAVKGGYEFDENGEVTRDWRQP